MEQTKQLLTKIETGINGFGRFGLHLLKYWLDRSEETNFTIDFINDDFLTIQDAFTIITTDHAVTFNKYKISCDGDDRLRFLKSNGTQHVIEYTNNKKTEISWLGKPKFFFECTGKYTTKQDCLAYIGGNTKLVFISATSWDPDETLIYGFNHTNFQKNQFIISYGSCTVNAYVPLAQYLHKKYTIIDSDANFIHNIQAYKLKKNFNTLIRKFCTLEKSGPNLLKFIDANNFTVNYTVVPYAGVSMLDLRFRFENGKEKERLIEDLEFAFSEGELKHLYFIDEVDIGPEVYNCTTYSAIFIKQNIRIIGDNLYLHGYFDNENSVNRYFDLVHYIASETL